MFGYFKRKLYYVNCPVCLREYKIKFNPEEVKSYNYIFKEGAGVVFTLECDFCDGHAKIVHYRTGEVEALDYKWSKIEYEHQNEVEETKAELANLKERLEKEPDRKDLKNSLDIAKIKFRNHEKNFKEEIKKYASYKAEFRKKWKEELKHA